MQDKQTIIHLDSDFCAPTRERLPKRPNVNATQTFTPAQNAALQARLDRLARERSKSAAQDALMARAIATILMDLPGANPTPKPGNGGGGGGGTEPGADSSYPRNSLYRDDHTLGE